MPITSSPHSTCSLSTISSTSSGSSSNNPILKESLVPSLPKPAVPKPIHARNRQAHISAPPGLGYHNNTDPPVEHTSTHSRRKHISLPADSATTLEQSRSTPTEISPLKFSPGTGPGKNAPGNQKSDKSGHGSKNFDFSYRNIYITPGAPNGMGRARVGNGSGVPAGNCVLM